MCKEIANDKIYEITLKAHVLEIYKLRDLLVLHTSISINTNCYYITVILRSQLQQLALIVIVRGLDDLPYKRAEEQTPCTAVSAPDLARQKVRDKAMGQ